MDLVAIAEGVEPQHMGWLEVAETRMTGPAAEAQRLVDRRVVKAGLAVRREQEHIYSQEGPLWAEHCTGRHLLQSAEVLYSDLQVARTTGLVEHTDCCSET